MAHLEIHWFEDFFDAVYQYTWILATSGKVIKANQAALKLTGLTQEDISSVPLWAIPWPALSRQNRQVLRQAVNQAAKGKFVRYDLEIRQQGQPSMILNISLKPILVENGEFKFMIAEGRDITAHKRTAEALYQSEARFETIFEKAGIGIVIKDIDGKMLDCNPAFRSMLGYTIAELVQREYQDITHPLDQAVSRKLFNELVNGKRKSYFIEKRYLHKDGHVIWGRITTSLVQGPDGQPQFVIGMVEDIATQKQIETELTELQRRLMQGREMERLRIAQDLHDGPLQEIIGVSYQVQELENAVKEEFDREQLHSINDSLQNLAKSMRGICGELRPPTLIPFGLEKTILSHAEQFQAAHLELKIKLDLADVGEALSEQSRIVLYRIYQEALNNIVRHAQATSVWVHFWLEGEQAILEVKDNGVGFELPNRWIKLARQGHLGLVGAMERAKDAGGSLEVSTASGRGTLIRAILPVTEETFQGQAPGEE